MTDDAALAAQRVLLSQVSRELRTPLVAVIGMAGLLLETELGARQRYCAEAIRHSGETLLEILNRLHQDLGITAEQPAAEVPEAAEAGAPVRRRVLVAEDDAINRKVVSHMLERRGWIVDVVGNGREAVDAVHRHRYDLVVMDCDMPDVDGYAASAAIRARETPKSGRIPIVAMTAAVMPGDRDRCLASGMDDYVAKPFSADALDRVLRRWTEPASPA